MNEEQIFGILDKFTTADDFYGDEFRQIITAPADNEVDQMRLERKLRDKAKSFKITNAEFDRLVKLFRKQEQMDLQSLPDDQNRTEFPGQPVEMKCRRYICNEKGVIFVADNAQAVEIISHPILPVKRFVNIDTGMEKIELKFKRGQQNWSSVIVPKKTIASNTDIVNLSNCGIEVNSENAKFIIKFLSDVISENYDDIPVQSDTSRLGWMGETFIPYNDDIVFNDLESEEFYNKYKSVSEQKGTLEAWKATVQGKRNREEVNLPFRVSLAASFASPLAEKFGIPPFITNMVGGSGTGKTVSLQTDSSVWGCPVYGDPLQWWSTLNITTVALEHLAAFAYNLPVCLDERQVKSGAGRGTDLTELVYMFCEGQGRGRGQRVGGNRKTKHWRNILICNGEQMISSNNSKPGEQLRIIDLLFEGKMFRTASEAGSFMESINNNYGHAGKEFIAQFIQDDKEKLKARLDELISEINATASGRQSRSGALLVLADELAEKYIFQDGVKLTVQEISKFLKTDEDVDLNVRIYRMICDWLVVNRSKLIDKRHDPNGSWIPGLVYGKIDDEDSAVFYIVPSILKKEIFTANNFEWELFRRWAVEHNVIIPHPTKSSPYRTETRVSVPGSSKDKLPMYEFHINALDNDEDEDENPAPAVPEGITQVQMDDDDLPW